MFKLVDYLSIGIKAGVVPRQVADDIVKLEGGESPFRYVLVMNQDVVLVDTHGNEYAMDFVPWQLVLGCEVLTDFAALQTAQLLFQEISFWGNDLESQEIYAALMEQLNLL